MYAFKDSMRQVEKEIFWVCMGSEHTLMRSREGDVWLFGLVQTRLK
jgi:hypothetical protein